MRIRPTLFCLLSLVLGAWVSAADPTGAVFKIVADTGQGAQAAADT